MILCGDAKRDSQSNVLSPSVYWILDTIAQCVNGALPERVHPASEAESFPGLDLDIAEHHPQPPEIAIHTRFQSCVNLNA